VTEGNHAAIASIGVGQNFATLGRFSSNLVGIFDSDFICHG
jgi:hypothetical protein